MKDFFFHFNARRLECLRFWLLHAIGSIHTYLSGQVLQSLGLILENSLAQAKDLDTIIQIHNDYLDKAHEHCLQTPQFADIMTTINNVSLINNYNFFFHINNYYCYLFIWN